MNSESTRVGMSMRNPGLLPQIVGVEAVRMRYERPRVYYADRQRREAREAVEIMVRTSEELPIADVSPALFVGEVPLVEYEGAGPNVYRFFAFQFEKLREGDPISLGWPYSPEHKVRTNFRYHVKGGFPVA
ncbi:MAG: hypothetical protein ACREYC_21845 [Gammaproteobacteria bacterium]